MDKQSILRIKNLMYEQHLNQAELSKKSGVSTSTISNVMKGNFNPRYDTLAAIAEALNTTVAYLRGETEIPSRYDVITETQNTPQNYGPAPQKKKLPLLGKIACGNPLYSDGHVETYVDPGHDIDADFCLIAEGDSMIGAHIQDGDIVFVKEAQQVANGQIAAIRVGDDEFTLKRFYHDPVRSVVQLIAENPSFPPIVKTGAEIEDVHIVGLVVGFHHDFY